MNMIFLFFLRLENHFFYNSKEVKLVRFFPFGNPCRRFMLSQKDAEFFSRSWIDLNIKLYQKMELVNNHQFKISELPQSIYNLPYDGQRDRGIVSFLKYTRSNLKTWN